LHLPTTALCKYINITNYAAATACNISEITTKNTTGWHQKQATSFLAHNTRHTDSHWFQ